MTLIYYIAVVTVAMVTVTTACVRCSIEAIAADKSSEAIIRL